MKRAVPVSETSSGPIDVFGTLFIDPLRHSPRPAKGLNDWPIRPLPYRVESGRQAPRVKKVNQGECLVPNKEVKMKYFCLLLCCALVGCAGTENIGVARDAVTMEAIDGYAQKHGVTKYQARAILEWESDPWNDPRQ